MTYPKDRASDLAGLLGDVMSAGYPEPELLLRYVDNPESLNWEDRQAIEMHLSRSPRLADTFKVLKTLDLAALVEQAADEPVRQGRDSLKEVTSRLLAALRGLFDRSPILTWSAVAALLALLLYSTILDFATQTPSGVQPSPIAQGPGVPDRVAQLPLQPSQQQPQHQTTVAESTPSKDPAPREKRPPVTTNGTREREPAREPAASPPVEAKPSPIVLAMVRPTYRAPAGAPPRRRPSGFARGAGSHLTLTAVAPSHLARTLSEQPSLFWYLSETPPPGTSFEFTLADENSPDPLVQAALPGPSEAGFQRINLSGLGARLPSSVSLRWSVALQRDPDQPSHDIVAEGWIERVAASASLAARLERTGPADAPVIYAESGYWYDAFSTLSDLIDRYPENVSLTQARTELLRQADLDAIAEAK